MITIFKGMLAAVVAFLSLISGGGGVPLLAPGPQEWYAPEVLGGVCFQPGPYDTCEALVLPEAQAFGFQASNESLVCAGDFEPVVPHMQSIKGWKDVEAFVGGVVAYQTR